MPAYIDIEIVSQLIQQSVEGFYDYQKQGCTTRQGTVKRGTLMCQGTMNYIKLTCQGPSKT